MGTWSHSPITALSLVTAFRARRLEGGAQGSAHTVSARACTRQVHPDRTQSRAGQRVGLPTWRWALGAGVGSTGLWRVPEGCHCVGTQRERLNERDTRGGLLVGHAPVTPGRLWTPRVGIFVPLGRGPALPWLRADAGRLPLLTDPSPACNLLF